jgi:hypothetical protein
MPGIAGDSADLIMDHPEPPKRSTTQPLAWHQLAEQRIRAAQEAGEFDRLPGFGQPIPGIDEPHDELWWVKDKLKREQIQSLPPALVLRRDVEEKLKRVNSLTCEGQVRSELTALNARIRKLSFGVTWGPPVDVQPLDIEETVSQWRKRQIR